MSEAEDVHAQPIGVPSHPLPLPAHARLALVGDRSERTAALGDLLHTVGRELARFHVDELGGTTHVIPADVVFISCEPAALVAIAQALRLPLQGLVVVCTVAATPVERDRSEDGTGIPSSAAQRLSSALPTSRIVGALQQFGRDHLRLLAVRCLTTDAPITGDDREATDLVAGLLDGISGIEAVYAGSVRNSLAVEGLAQMLERMEPHRGRHVGFRLDPLRGLVILDGGCAPA